MKAHKSIRKIQECDKKGRFVSARSLEIFRSPLGDRIGTLSGSDVNCTFLAPPDVGDVEDGEVCADSKASAAEDEPGSDSIEGLFNIEGGGLIMASCTSGLPSNEGGRTDPLFFFPPRLVFFLNAGLLPSKELDVSKELVSDAAELGEPCNRIELKSGRKSDAAAASSEHNPF